MDFGNLKMYVGGELINATNNIEKIILCPADNKPIAKLSWANDCLLYTSPSPRDGLLSRMPSSA